ncbi:tRNA splicing endonuclease subunit 2 [Rhynchophorus ferrugineus]|uniref:tRNA splicing endonuclease subunit 2 n=1 Tax=Rhynchophorus ferrugineus TaxID=354439 RepID=UPI003FCD4895
MELIEPKAKRHCKLRPKLPLPIIFKKDGSIKKFSANFNGFAVIVSDVDDMKNLVSMGYFGKANFSRSYPQFTKSDTCKILRERQFKYRKDNFNHTNVKQPAEKVIVVPNSDEEDNNYFINLKPKFELDYSNIKETVWLGLEEAFFLTNVLGCLEVTYKNDILTVENMWELFSNTQPTFIRNYIVYYYYKAKKWVVKPGIKFGGDFLLYKQGPPFYHASYVVIIQIVNSNLENQMEDLSLDNVSLSALNRLCETAGKELLICKIHWPSQVQYNDFSNIEIEEVLIRRWVPSQERDEI